MVIWIWPPRSAVELHYGVQDETWCWCGLLAAAANQFLRSDSECNAPCPLYEEGDYYGGGESQGQAWTAESATEGDSR